MEVVFKIHRFDPSKDVSPYYKQYKITIDKGTTVLEALLYIKERLDNSLAIRYSCRMGICGSCGMRINGIPMLACKTQVSMLKSNIILIEPLSNNPIIKDLVTNFSNLFAKHKMIKPYIIRKDSELDNPTREYLQKPNEFFNILQFALCIKCGLCWSACPISSDNRYLGPFVLAQAYRYISDSRDDGYNERFDIIDSPHGCWRCHFAGSCSQVCPRGVDPALAIQLLKKSITTTKLGLKKIKTAAPVAPPLTEVTRKLDVPQPPPRTVFKNQRDSTNER
ncbi:MAG: succinate dehydrogenase iron-sulfur subunit [Nitrososphaerales archaeon]